jgi:hypothetical protein
MKLLMVLVAVGLALPLWALSQTPSAYACTGPRCIGSAPALVVASALLMAPAGLRAAWLMRRPHRSGVTRALGWVLALIALLVAVLAVGLTFVLSTVR